jgi:hypothetical protein
MDKPGDRDLKDNYATDGTTRKCISVCKDNHFAYAGLQNRLIFNMNVNDEVVHDIYFLLKLFKCYTL